MPKFVTLLMILTTSAMASASPNYIKLSQKLYPESAEDQAFVTQFFKIVELHKTHDPLFEGPGPSIHEYSLDRIKFAFMVNDRGSKIDLVFFNWNLPSFLGLEHRQGLSQLYGSAVYILEGVDKITISSQGANDAQLTNFSYLLGARHLEAQVLLDAPAGYQVPEQFSNFKPNPEYMERSHPLRKTLGKNILFLLSPKKELLFQQGQYQESQRQLFELMLNQRGGAMNTIMGLMVHEMYHGKEGEDHVNRLAKRRKAPESGDALIKQLEVDTELRNLLSTYAKIIFSIGDQLKNPNALNLEQENLSELKSIILAIKARSPDAWQFIWDYEYKEGFAEYASVYSMIQGGVISLSQGIDLNKKNANNNFTYRTGTVGGLYLAYRLTKMPFQSQEDHTLGVWEIILDQLQTTKSSMDIRGIMQKYSSYPFDTDKEMNMVIHYLISTVLEL